VVKNNLNSTESSEEIVLQAVLNPLLAIYLKRSREILNQLHNTNWVFLSREGKLLKELIDRSIFRKELSNIHTNYLEVSRRSLAFALTSAGKLNSNLVAHEHFHGNVSQLWNARFGIPLELIKSELTEKRQNSRISPGDQWAIITEMRIANQVIPKLSSNNFEITREYLSGRLQTRGGVTVISDIGYRGTMQRMIEMILGQKFTGFYVAASPDPQYDLNVLSANNGSMLNLILQNVPLLESLFDIGDSSVIGYEKGIDQINVLYEERIRASSPFRDRHKFIPDQAIDLSHESFELLEFMFRYNFPHRIKNNKHLFEMAIKNEIASDTWSGTNFL
jgi:hypothetical protein